ncbi:MAG: PAS domain-containing protein [Thermoplasmata archaeon]
MRTGMGGLLKKVAACPRVKAGEDLPLIPLGVGTIPRPSPPRTALVDGGTAGGRVTGGAPHPRRLRTRPVTGQEDIAGLLENPGGTPLPLFLASSDGEILRLNDEAISLFESLKSLCGEEERQELRRILKTVGQTGSGQIVELSGPDGSIQLTVLPMPPAAGEGGDEKGKRKACGTLPVIPSPEALPVFVYFLSTSGSAASSWVGGKVKELTGFSPLEFIERPALWKTRIHPEDQRRVLRALRELALGGAARLVYRWLRADGVYRWVLDCASPVPDSTGGRAGIAGVRVDITDLKAVEEARRSESEFCDEMLGSMPAGVCIVDRRLRCIFINNWFEEMTGFRREDVARGRVVLEAHPEDLKSLLACIGGVMKGERRRLRCRLMTSGGQYRIAELLLSRLRWKGLSLVQMVAIPLELQPDGQPLSTGGEGARGGDLENHGLADPDPSASRPPSASGSRETFGPSGPDIA